MYCKVSWFKPFQSRKEAVIGKKYTTLDYQKIVSDYENKVEGIKIRQYSKSRAITTNLIANLLQYEYLLLAFMYGHKI